jgi:hypothetical protein
MEVVDVSTACGVGGSSEEAGSSDWTEGELECRAIGDGSSEMI